MEKGWKIITFLYLFTALWVRANNVIFFDAKGKINSLSTICFLADRFSKLMFLQTISVICIKTG